MQNTNRVYKTKSGLFNTQNSLRHYFHNHFAVTPMVSTILTLIIVVSGISMVLSWGVPYIDRLNTDSQQQNVYNQFDLWNEGLKDLTIEGAGSARINNFAFASGYFNVDPTGNRLIVYYFYESGYDIYLSGFTDDGFTITALSDLPLAKKIDKIKIKWPETEDPVLYEYGTSDDIQFEDDSGTISGTVHDIEGTVEFYFRDSADPPNTNLGEGWIFDLGRIYWNVNTKDGSYRIECENGGILVTTPTMTEHLKKGATIYTQNDEIFLSVPLIRYKDGTGFTAGGPTVDTVHNVLTELTATNITKDGESVYNLRMKLDENHQSSWTNYFEDYDFDPIPSYPDTLEYIVVVSPELTFITFVYECRVRVSR